MLSPGKGGHMLNIDEEFTLTSARSSVSSVLKSLGQGGWAHEEVNKNRTRGNARFTLHHSFGLGLYIDRAAREAESYYSGRLASAVWIPSFLKACPKADGNGPVLFGGTILFNRNQKCGIMVNLDCYFAKTS